MRPRGFWTRDRIVEALQAWAGEHGQAPSSAEALRSPDLPGYRTVRAMFGSWRAGVEAAGLDVRHRPAKWTRENFIDALQTWAAAHGRQPGHNDWRTPTEGYPASSSAVHLFGSWKAALAAAGFDARDRGRPRVRPRRFCADCGAEIGATSSHCWDHAKRGSKVEWTPERVIAALQASAGRTGRAPTATEWRAAGVDHPAVQTVIARFGSWAAGVRAAGLTPVSEQAAA